MYRKGLLSLFLLFYIVGTQAQPAKSDSLKKILSEYRNRDLGYIDLLNEIAYTFYNQNTDSTLIYATKAKELAESNNYKKGQAWAFLHTGYACLKKADFKKSITLINKGLMLFTQENDFEGIAAAHNLLGIRAYFLSDYDEAIYYFEKAAEGHRKTDNILGLAKVYNNLGVISKKSGNYHKALDYYQNALNIEIESGDKKGVSELYNNIAIIHRTLEDYDEALNNYNKAYALNQELGIIQGTELLANNMGMLYLEKGELQKAYEKLKLSLSIKEKTGEYGNMPVTYNSLGKCFILQAKYDSALYYLNKSIEFFDEESPSSNWAWANCNLGLLYWEVKDYYKSISYANESYHFGREIGNIELIKQSAHILAQCHSELGSFESALGYIQEYYALKDSLFNTSLIRKTTAFKYEQEKLKTEHLLKSQNLIIQQKHQQFKLSLIFLSLVLALVAWIIHNYLKIKKKNRLLFERNLELTSIEQNTASSVSFRTNKKTVVKEADTNEEVLLEALRQHLLIEKIYTDKTLTLDKLAEKLNTNRSYLSRCINNHYKCNFNRLINKYRIKEARALLTKPHFKNYTMEGIAKEVGFNSKSAFNFAFKEYTGLTPSYYKNKAQSS